MKTHLSLITAATLLVFTTVSHALPTDVGQRALNSMRVAEAKQPLRQNQTVIQQPRQLRNERVTQRQNAAQHRRALQQENRQQRHQQRLQQRFTR